MTISELNALSPVKAAEEFLRCCGSSAWAEQMAKQRPFENSESVYTASRRVCEGLAREDWMEAFRRHPKLGDRKTLEKKFAATAKWAAGEQSGTTTATPEVLDALAEKNEKYLAKFGFIFILCATGKSAAEMLEALGRRIGNDPTAEITLAAGEQKKITLIRLEKLLS